jgi:hypothetical protein
MPRLTRDASAALSYAALSGAALTFVALFAVEPTGAHTPVTSKYTYNEHVYPILRDRCGGCHVDGGVAPMSLLTYQDARPWSESIREELIAERMPPWHVDPAGSAAIALPRSAMLTAKELDTIVVWATGGTPEGDPSKRPPPAVARSEWRSGRPDAILMIPEPAVVPADRREDTRTVVIASGLGETRWLRGVDLLPGTPSMVHDASVGIENGREIAVWTPGETAAMLPAGTAIKLDAGRKLTLRIHYKKSWRDEQAAKSDRSAIGLYFTSAPADGKELQNVQADATPLAQAMTLMAIRPIVDRAYATLDVQAQLPSGSRIRLLRLRNAHPAWPRRYVLTRPIDLPAGTRLEISTEPRPPQGRVTVSLDVVR